MTKLELLQSKRTELFNEQSVAMTRINTILDQGSFVETGRYAKSRPTGYAIDAETKKESVVCGFGSVNSKKAYVFSQDSSVGGVSEMHCQKIRNVLNLAGKTGSPVIGFFDMTSERKIDGAALLDGYAGIMSDLSNLTGIVPLIAVVSGKCSGTMAVIAQMFDIVIMTESGQLGFDKKTFYSAPLAKSGAITYRIKTDEDAASLLKDILSYIPSNHCVVQDANGASSESFPVNLSKFIPEGDDEAVDMSKIVSALCDDGKFLEYAPEFGKTVFCGFAKFGSVSSGIVANLDELDSDGANKAVSFLKFCDSFDLPIVTLVDSSGISKADEGLLASAYAKLASCYSMITAVKITVIIKKAYGGAYSCMCPKGLGADISLALASSVIAIRDVLPSDLPFDEAAFNDGFCSSYLAAKLGLIDDVIDPQELRTRIVRGIKTMYLKRESRLPRKHLISPL